MTSVWRHRDFRLVWAGGLVNDIGDWLLMVALPVFVLTETGSGAATALLFAIEYGVATVLGPVSGALVDRWDLRRTLIATNVAQAMALVPLLAVTADRVWPAFLVAAAQATLTRLNNPAGAALLPRLVRSDLLVAAAAVAATSSNLARLLGSPLGGIVVELGGMPAVVVADGVSFLVVAAAMWLVRSPNTGPVERAGADGRDTGTARDAWRMARRHPVLRPLMNVAIVVQVAQGMFVVLFVAFVLDVLDSGGAAVGVIRGLQAVGGIIGAVAIGRWSRGVRPGMLLAAGSVGMGTVAALTWNASHVTTTVAWFAVLFACAGVPAAAMSVGMVTTAQRSTPPAFMGRFVGLIDATTMAGAGLGSLAAGVALDHVGIVPLLDVQAALYVGAGGYAWSRLRGVAEPAGDDLQAQRLVGTLEDAEHAGVDEQP